jgi:hypothetical protein
MGDSWYDANIEAPVRKIVHLLRDNGFNTECSCGHEMYVQCQYMTDGELQRLDKLLCINGHENYEIQVVIRRKDGQLFSSMNICF